MLKFRNLAICMKIVRKIKPAQLADVVPLTPKAVGDRFRLKYSFLGWL
jgi:hypothetical protein